MRNLIISFSSILFGLLLSVNCAAQTQDPAFERLDQMMQRMQEQMRRSMQFDSSFGRGQMQISPDSNSFFYFHVDTSFNGTGSEFFDFSPFGSPDMQDFFGMDPLFKQFFGPQHGPGEFPSDDGQSLEEDGLLPEERLRLQEEKEKNGEKTAPAAKPKVKTIRI